MTATGPYTSWSQDGSPSSDEAASPVPDVVQLPEDAVERAHRAHLGLAPALERMRSIPADALIAIEPEQANDWIRGE